MQDLLYMLKPPSHCLLNQDLSAPTHQKGFIIYVRPVSIEEMKSLDCESFFSLVAEERLEHNEKTGSPRDELKKLVRSEGKPVTSAGLANMLTTINGCLRERPHKGQLYRVHKEMVNQKTYFQLWHIEIKKASQKNTQS